MMVKRVDYDRDFGMMQDIEGEYVEYTDYATLEAMCERLAGALTNISGFYDFADREALGEIANTALAAYNAMLGKGDVCQHDYIVKRIDGTCPKCTSTRRQGKGE